MQHHRFYVLITLCLLLFSTIGKTQTIWSDEKTLARTSAFPTNKQLPSEFRLLNLNAKELNRILKLANKALSCLEIPLPNGEFDCFNLQPTAILHPDLAKKLPNTQTFSGQSLRHPTSSMQMVWDGAEFHAIVLTQSGIVMIDKINNENKPYYVNYYLKDVPTEPFTCETDALSTIATDPIFKEETKRKITPLDTYTANARNSSIAVGTELKTYRLAMAVSAEQTIAIGGKVAAMNRVIQLTNDLNAILGRDLSIRFELIATNDELIFEDPVTDPYTNGGLNAYLTENVTFMNETVGAANFDIGHVINTTTGGLAFVGVVCATPWKAGGTSPNNIEVLSHEIGHQLGGTHTFNYCGGQGAGDFEPGSGNTILSYFGNCGVSNMPGEDLLQFHASSYQEIVSYMHFGGGATCSSNTNTGHHPPSVTVPPSSYTIPVSTPFKLTGSATDDGGQAALTYLWEQYDKGGSSPPQNPTGTAPIFRSLPYSNIPSRTFPELSKIVNGTTDLGETLPTYSRDLNFRFMVHDNHPDGGGVDFAELLLKVDEGAGPFEVNIPNDSETIWSAGQNRTVLWNVANTDAAPVSCATVNILASFDGGFTYPDTLAKGVSNDGEQVVVVPDTVNNQTRIKIEAADNFFFDISDANFEIISADTNDFILMANPEIQLFCAANTATFQIDLIALGMYNSPVNLSLSGLPNGLTADLPATVAPISTTTLTLNNLATLAAGNYVMTLTATEDGGVLSKTKDLQIIIKGMPATTKGNALNLDGDAYVTIPDNGNLYQFGANQDFSVEGWFKTTYSGFNGTIIAKRDSRQSRGAGWSVYMRSGAIRFAMGDGNDRIIQETPNTFNDGEWHHFAVAVSRTGGGKFQIYIDGHLEVEQNNLHVRNVNNDLPIGIGADSKQDFRFLGQIEELRTWKKALNPTEIREHQHRILPTCQPDLISYWQFNEESGDVLDVLSAYNGTNTGATRVPSTCPIGIGTANTQLEKEALVSFSNTDFQAKYEFLDGATVTATKLTNAPSGNGGILPADLPLEDQYWLLNRYEKDGNWQADLTFTTTESITAEDEVGPSSFKLYQRAFNSGGDWLALAHATAADATNNTLTFPNIATEGQYLISRTNETVMTVSTQQLGFCQATANPADNIQSYVIGGTGLIASISLTVTGNFEISLDASSGFSQSLTLSPTDGVVGLTKIFVRPTASTVSLDIGQITHTSDGATSQILDLALKAMGRTPSNLLDGTDGGYMTLPRNDALLFGANQDFTIEFWIHTDAINADPSIISNKNWSSGSNVGWGIFYLEGGWKVNINGTGGSRIDLNSSLPAINDGNWHHLAVVFDRDDQLNIYQDGELSNQILMASLDGKNIDSGLPINVFQDGTGAYSPNMNAKIDELRFWNIARTSEQIKARMNQTLSCLENGLVAYYQFNETEGECRDEIGGHHGTLRNGAVRNSSNVPINVVNDEACVDHRQLSDLISTGVYQFKAKDTLSSTADLMTGSEVEYLAGKVIILKPGFSVAAGGQFSARIATCELEVIQEDQSPSTHTVIQHSNRGLEASNSHLPPIELLVYPNPVGNNLQVQINTEVQEEVEIGIQNNLGMVLYQKKELIHEGFYQTNMQMTGFPKGMYWVKVRFMETGVWQTIPVVKN